MNGAQILSVLSMGAMALAQPHALHKRAVSYVTDLPADTYKEDDKVTIIITATIGGIAGLVLISILVFAIVRRRKRGLISKHVEDEETVQEANVVKGVPHGSHIQAHFPSAPE
ncbi:hypothetical protein H4S00_004471 [Coemansia sp. D1744]|nr:hypothetical protein H4S00_004471 [Coemansia sp. D1744]